MSGHLNRAWEGMPSDLPAGWHWTVRRNLDDETVVLRLCDEFDGYHVEVEKPALWFGTEERLAKWVRESAHKEWDAIKRSRELDSWLEAKSWQ